ncbi:MAG: hypothetical protein EZS28_040444 [Streblomastix strix]|uniref:Uncharacterized protein n=1 Tax=Streblomastix strix TaxID=222440 RepID=A0A5J4U182_9EUKA|nr:MAG: hypothetical protein EZS28_040444 [Streblomastix strix]
MSKSKKQMSEIKHKELTDEDKIRLQLIDEAISRIKSMPTVDETIKPKEQQEVVNDSQSTRSHKKYNINKYQEVDRTTAQIEPEETIKQLAEEQPKLQYLSHPNLIVQKFVIDTIWRTITHRQRGDDFIFSSDNFIKFWSLITQNDEQDVEIVLEEAIIQPHTCIPRKYKKKDLIRVQDILIKNVSVKVLDNVLYNSIEKLYRVNCDFIRLSDAPEVEITDNDF